MHNSIKKMLGNGESVIGTFCTLPSPHLMDVIGSSGVDFAVLDGEHGPLGFETLQLMSLVLEHREVTPLIRVSGPEESEILHALDIGSGGIHIPNIRTLDELAAVVRFAKYEPRGQRGFSPFMRACNYSHINTDAYLGEANHRSLIVVHVEGEAGLKLLPNFSATEDIDILFVGLFDLTKSMGIAGQMNHPRLMQILQSIGEMVERAGKVWGTIVTSFDQIEIYRKLGMRYFTFSVDCEIIQRAYQEIVQGFKNGTRN